MARPLCGAGNGDLCATQGQRVAQGRVAQPIRHARAKPHIAYASRKLSSGINAYNAGNLAHFKEVSGITVSIIAPPSF